MIERDALVVGGPVEPVFEGDLPAWCTDRFIHYIAGWDRGGDVHDLVYNHYPRGNNIAFRRAVFETFGPFSRHLGRIGHTLLSCEETEICLRVERAGGRIVYSPGARIRHLTRTERITPRWMKARFFAQGRSEAILEWMHGGWRGLSLGWRRWQQMYARAASQRTRPPDGEIFARCNRQALLGHTRALVTAPFTVPRYHPASGAAPWLPFQ